jgi:hypothetical protein
MSVRQDMVKEFGRPWAGANARNAAAASVNFDCYTKAAANCSRNEGGSAAVSRPSYQDAVVGLSLVKKP